MIIFLFFLTWATTFSLLMFFSGLSYWFAFLWIFLGLISGYLMVGLIIIITLPLVFWAKESNKLKHFYLRNLCDFVRLFILRLYIVDIIGKENVPKDTNFGAYGNHRSGVDPLVVLSTLRVPMAFMAKNNLFKYKIGSKWLKGFGILEIDRKNAREALKEINKGTELMNEGLSMVVFPEGTRKKDDFHNLDTFRAGAFKITTAAKLPILPFALIGAEKFGKQVVKKSTRVRIIIDKPIYYEEYKDFTPKDLSNYVARKIMVLLKENENL